MSNAAAERGREVRQRLLAAAVELVPERGWSAVSTRTLAERAGVTPSVVHYHFPSLRALLNEAAVGVMSRILADSETFLDTVREPSDVVDAILASVDRYTGTDRLSLLSLEAYLAATRDDELRRRIADVVDGFRERLAGKLREGGVASPGETAAVLAAAVDGLLLHRGLGSGPDSTALTPVLRRLLDHERKEPPS